MPPRASRPVGIALLDKPAGPSSFAIVAELRRRTGARTGHTGTLDPFATGLLVLMSGAATRLAPCFVGLDKRYVTEIDLTATTTTGDPEGEIAERHRAPSAQELENRLVGLRGEVELPVPAHSAVKVGGERAYKLARQGTAVEMPLRRSQVYALAVLAGDAESVTLDRTSAQAPTCARSRRRSAGIAGRCGGPRSGRSRGRGRPRAADAGLRGARAPSGRGGRPRARGDPDARARPRGCRALRVARAPGELERRPRAVAIGTFDGVHMGHQSVVAAGDRRRAAADRGHVSPASAGGARQPGRAARDARAPARAPGRARRRGDARRRVHTRARGARAGGVRRLVPGRDRRRGRRRGRGVPLRPRAQRRPRPAGAARDRRSACAAGRGRLLDAHPAPRRAPATSEAPPPLLGRPVEVEGTVVSGEARGGTLGFPTANLRIEPTLLVPGYGIYAGAALDQRAATSIGVNPHYGGAERKVEVFLLDFEGDLYGRRLVVELWERLRDEAAFESEAELVEQIARDVAGDAGGDAPRYFSLVKREAADCYPFRRPRPGRARLPCAAFAGTTANHTTRRMDCPHQGSQAGSNETVRQERERHRLAGGSDRDADRADQRPHRASADAQEGSLLAPRASHAGRTPPPVPELPAKERRRGLSRPHQGARPAPLVPSPRRAEV